MLDSLQGSAFKAAEILMTARMGGQGRRNVILGRRARRSNAVVGDSELHRNGQACPLGCGEATGRFSPPSMAKPVPSLSSLPGTDPVVRQLGGSAPLDT